MSFAPRVSDPITSASPGVYVLGALDGAEVQLQSDGIALADPVQVSSPWTFVPVPPGGLVAGAKITATQALNGDVSAPTRVPVIVAAVPVLDKNIPAPVFIGNVHPWIDWVTLSALVPGTTVVVRYKGVEVGALLATRATEAVRVKFPEIPAPGDVLTAQTTVKLASGEDMGGGEAISPPMLNRDREGPAVPTIGPIYECDVAVDIGAVEDGASVALKQPGKEFLYPGWAPSFKARLERRAALDDTFTVQQKFASWGIESAESQPPSTVGKPRNDWLPTPWFPQPVCPDAPEVMIAGLREGAEVTCYVKLVYPGGSMVETVDRFQAWSTECSMPLPPGWADPPRFRGQAGQLFIHAEQRNCSLLSSQGMQEVLPGPSAVDTPRVEPPVECARLVVASGLTPGAFVQVLSDNAKWSQLCLPQLVRSAQMVLGLNRPLEQGEHITVAQQGCGANAQSNPPMRVGALDGLNAPVIESPVRIPHGGAWVRDLVVGGRLYVTVDDKPRPSMDITSTRMFVPLGKLKREMRVQVLQVMCTAMPKASNVGETALGKLDVSVSPKTITRGVATNITVTALDADTHAPVAATVYIGNQPVGGTNTPFTYTFGPGAAPPSSVVADDYENAALGWSLVDRPAPPPATPPAAKLSVTLNDNTGGVFKILKVSWSLLKRVPPDSATEVASTNGTSAQLTPGTNGQLLLTAEVTVQKGEDAPILAQFRGPEEVRGVQAVKLQWNGASMSMSFKLFYENKWIADTGIVYITPYVVQTL